MHSPHELESRVARSEKIKKADLNHKQYKKAKLGDLAFEKAKFGHKQYKKAKLGDLAFKKAKWKPCLKVRLIKSRTRCGQKNKRGRNEE